MKKRRFYVQILACPPLTSDDKKRAKMDRQSDKMTIRRFARTFKEAREKGYAELAKLEAKLPPYWEGMIWVEEVRRRA